MTGEPRATSYVPGANCTTPRAEPSRTPCACGRHWAAQPVPQMVTPVIGESPAYATVQCAAPLHCVVLGGGPIAELAIGS
jgi:hypothetical protein